MIDDGRFIFSYYHYKKSFRFLNHCRKISVPSLSIIFEGLALSSGPLRNRNLLQLVQKVMVCDLRLVDLDSFCVCSLLLN